VYAAFKMFNELGRLLAFATVYFFAARLGLALAFAHTSISPVWPPTGIALAATLLWGYRIWPGILLGAFVANAALTPVSLPVAAVIAAGNTLEALAGRFLLQRSIQASYPFDQAERCFKFVLIGGLSCIISATIGVASLCLAHSAAWVDAPFLWGTWWLGDTTGLLLVAPLILAWFHEKHIDWKPSRIAEMSALLVCLSIVTELVFGGWFRTQVMQYALAFTLLPFFMWTAFRFGLWSAMSTVLFVSAVGILGTIYGVGPFVRADLNESLFLLQSFIGMCAVTILGMTAVLADRKRAEELLNTVNHILQQRVGASANELTTVLYALKDSEERFRLLVESVQDYAFFMLDRNGWIASWNTGAARITGYQAAEVIGRHFSCFYTSEDVVAGTPQGDLLAATDAGRFEDEGWRLRKDGSRFFAHGVITAIRDSKGELQAFGKVIQDMTAHRTAETKRKDVEIVLSKQNEELLDINAELERFAYVTSHDLKEPLRMITGYLGLLSKRYEPTLNKEAMEFVNFAVDGAKRMEVLITDLLTYSRMGPRQKKSEEVDCEKLFSRSAMDLTAVIDESGAEVTHDPLPTLMGDSTQLGQVFLNLMGNAIKYHGNEKPKVHVSAMRSGNEWRFSVSDNGIGMEPQYQERIFLLFQRLHTRAEYPGTGIGLAICKKVIEGHGGRIWVESESGKGSTFYFTIPC
jgi:PAS domain S-box-containing protein